MALLILNLVTRWMWVVRQKAWPLYSCWKNHHYVVSLLMNELNTGMLTKNFTVCLTSYSNTWNWYDLPQAGVTLWFSADEFQARSTKKYSQHAVTFSISHVNMTLNSPSFRGRWLSELNLAKDIPYL
jgi:hypothetical protein